MLNITEILRYFCKKVLFQQAYPERWREGPCETLATCPMARCQFLPANAGKISRWFFESPKKYSVNLPVLSGGFFYYMAHLPPLKNKCSEP